MFSIIYYKEGENAELAVDWDWNIKQQWARSDKEGPGARWYSTPGLDKDAYEAILKKFGLEEMRSELPLEELIKTGPYELGAIRRIIEDKRKLGRLEIISDTLGDHVRIS
jgi:hypothetical protein